MFEINLFCFLIILNFLIKIKTMRLVVRNFVGFCKYKVPYNINFEEHKNYLKKIERSEALLNES